MASTTKTYTLLLLGDVMLGRLIDQLLPTSVHAPEDAAHVKSFLSRNPQLKSYDYVSPWGNALPLLKSSDMILANLETAVTTHDVPWPNKVFNYRTHPENMRCLLEAGFGGGRGYVSLANNHTLDFGKEGLVESVRTLKQNGIAFAGVGESDNEAQTSAVLKLDNLEVRCWSFSDHPRDWKGVEGFNFLEYAKEGRDKMKRCIGKERSSGLKVVSLHWGPNYLWQPAKEIRELARWLVDECGVDVVHGHSSHHVQGVEVYKQKLIVYGCGDFLDDYAVTPGYRNDLSAAWRVSVREKEGKESFEVATLEMFPNRIQRFQSGLLGRKDADHVWLRRKFGDLCGEMGTRVEEELGDEGQIVIDVGRQRRG